MSTVTNNHTTDGSDSLSEALSVSRALSLGDDSIFGGEDYQPEDLDDSEINDGAHYLGVVDHFKIERYLAGEIFGEPVGKTIEIDVPIDGYSIRQDDGSFRIWLTVAPEYQWEPRSAVGFIKDIGLEDGELL